MDDSVPDDTRGIVDPDAMLRHVDFARYPVGESLDGLVEWFWAVAWDLPPGVVHEQQVLNHPAGHVSIGTLDDRGVPLDPPEGRVYGVLPGVSVRRLSATGWTVAARTAIGGLGVLLDRPAKEAAGVELRLREAIGGLGRGLVDDVAALGDNELRAAHLRQALAAVAERLEPARIAEAREVVGVARLAERDRTVRRVEQLAAAAGVSVRTLQRMFDTHVGASPSFVIRRWRIIEAVEEASRAAATGGEWRGWAQVAVELGYADQAHLTRDFRAHLGVSPTAYVARNTGGPVVSRRG